MPDTTHRPTVRLSEDEYQQVKYWAARKGLSINEYIVEAVQTQIRRENGDFDIPNAMLARVNQLVDIVLELSSNVNSLERVTTSGFDSLLGLTRGDNYLLEHEDGEI